MKDPLQALEESLAYMFELQTRKEGKYIHPSVQKLKNALENYKNGPSLSLRELVAAVKSALPVIENYVDGYVVKLRMETLAQARGVLIAWDNPYLRNRGYPHFQFTSAGPKIANDFIAWLSERANVEFSCLNGEEKVEIMLEQISENEFMTKLGEYLLKQPTFLSDLTLVSPKTFVMILGTRLGFELENHHIAKAIVYHSDFLMDNNLEPQEQLESYIEFLDGHLVILGRSVEKLLNDPLAREELDKSEIFRLITESKLNFQPS
ncbi:hypothetical protein [Legionella cardiaca]|uniref:Uncharacterized protein n=1 Tax=Legionella cardiaca TaxID=1071983 RepID=A0ABY8ATT8_9GAMM|nr:hypothetical protein [Legionella cardiaca]WED44088.1 hypothetical protein PXX05_04685 [Legionella cardiaca]